MQGFDRFFQPFLEQRSRWVLFVPVAIGLGVGLYFAGLREPSGGPVLAVLLALWAGFFLALWRNWAVRYVFLALALVALGFSAGCLRALTVAAPMLEKKLGPVTVEGRVFDVDRLENGAFRLVLEDMDIERLARNQTPARARVSVRVDSARPEPGDRVRLLAVLQPLSLPVAPGSFDFRRHAWFAGIGATGYALSAPQPVERDGDGPFFEGFRQTATDAIHKAVSDADSAAVTAALLLDERHEITDEIWHDIRAAGLAHLIAISGMHVGIVAGFVFFVVRALLALSERAALFWPIKKISALAAVLAAVGYMLVAGSPVPAQRSVLMLSVVMLAVILDREPFSLRLAAFAACCVLLAAPEALPGPSFQMSFAAVVALIAFYEEFAPGLGGWARGGGWPRRAALYLFGSMVTTVIASLATAPFSLYHFQQVALWASVIANMIAVPLTVFLIMPAGFIGLLLVPFGAGGPFFALAGFGNRLVIDLAASLADGPMNMLSTPAWPLSGFLLVVAGMLWAVLWRGWLRLGGMVFILAGAWLVATVPEPDVLVSGGGRLAAVRGDGGQLVFSSARREVFVRREWMRRDARGPDDKGQTWPGAGDPGRDGLTCDAAACLYRTRGRTVSFVRSRSALAEDCAAADVVIAMDLSIKAKDCRAPIVVDRWDLRDKGTHALYIGGDGKIILRNVAEERGDRPWAMSTEVPRRFTDAGNADISGIENPGLESETDPEPNNAGTGFSGDPEP